MHDSRTAKVPDVFPDYEAAMSFLNYQLPSMPSDLHSGGAGLDRVFRLLEDLGNPQNAHQVIHIAGTSGKGTTAYMIEAALRDHGLRTGLSVSPYVYDMRERWYVNGAFLATDEILAQANALLPALQRAQQEQRLVSRFEALICLAFLIMANQDIDYFVLETGMGGLLDPTNTVTRPDKIAVLTTIGLDHTHILGNDIVGIAAHKAGIIHAGNTVFANQQSDDINSAFEEAAQQHGIDVHFVAPNSDLAQQYNRGNGFAVNAALSLAVTRHVLAQRDMQLKDTTAALLADLTVPGRGERLTVESTDYLLDGAHNSQKIKVLVSDIEAMQPKNGVGAIVVIAKSQQMEEIILQLAEVVDEFVFVDYPGDIVDFKEAVDPAAAANFATSRGLSARTATYEEAVKTSMTGSHDLWLVTGSFYHLGPIKELLQSKKA